MNVSHFCHFQGTIPYLETIFLLRDYQRVILQPGWTWDLEDFVGLSW